jgi:hypothetical protein
MVSLAIKAQRKIIILHNRLEGREVQKDKGVDIDSSNLNDGKFVMWANSKTNLLERERITCIE